MTTEKKAGAASLDSSKHTKTTKQPSKEDINALWITYLNIVLYALCYQLQRPVVSTPTLHNMCATIATKSNILVDTQEPFLVEFLSKNAADSDAVAQTYGKLQAFFSAIQTVGSPLVGILLDRVGIRKASAVVFCASALSYAILASAQDMERLFLSKIPTALQHAFLIAQAVAATSTAGDDKARAQALGRVTTAYTIGASIGPALGGFLAGHGDLYLSARLAVVGSLVSVVLSLVYLPNASNPNKKEPTGDVSAPSSFWDDLRRQARLVLRASLLPLLVAKVVGGVAASIHSTALPLVLKDLQFDPALLGLAMSASMLGVAVFGATAMAPLTQRLGAAGLAQSGLALRVLFGSLLAFGVTTAMGGSDAGDTVKQFIIVASVFRELSSHALATGLTTQTTGAVTATEQGALLGLEHGLFSLARVGGPPLATWLLTSVGSFWAIASVCGGLDVGMIGLLLFSATSTARGTKSKLK
jgi:MFS family permease